MRPEQLQVEGFTAFRSMPEAIDFTGVELFAFTGATGAGKSSLIDAMCFAMYGRVPRLGMRLVEPIISLGMSEARVDFRFSVGLERFRVTRVLRRTARGGAQIAEACLEHDGKEMVGTDQVTAEVERVTGLAFEHFTKCVVLPQGEFSAFLHDKPADRQELLRSLLELEVYDRVRQRAVARKVGYETEAALLSAQLTELASVDAVAEDAAVARLDGLRVLKADVDAVSAELDRLRQEIAREESLLDSASAAVKVLGAVAIPGEVSTIAARVSSARFDLEQAAEALSVGGARLDEVERRIEDLPGLAVLDAEVALFQQHDLLRERIIRGSEMVASAATEMESTQALLRRAFATNEAKAGELQRARGRHMAHTLRAGLAVGDDCPVCGRSVTEIPGGTDPAGMDRLERDVEKAVEAVEHQRELATAAAARHARYQDQLVQLETEVKELEVRLPPDRSETTGVRAVVAALEEEQRSGREEVRRLRLEWALRSTAVDTAAKVESESRSGLDEARDRVASWAPPSLARVDLARDWETLVVWARVEQDRFADQVEVRRQARSKLAEERDRLESGLLASLGSFGLSPRGRSLVETAIEASTLAEQELDRVRETRRKAVAIGERLTERTIEAEVANRLARELAANGFEAWILEEALAGLLEGANSILAGLAGESYSLEIVKREFVVVDHRNAGDRRSVRTLSGGETFLVSLALALALAERVATMSAAGNARLESIFLDEGFGSLDGETLEVVAGALHELSARDRTVGIVTHVKELAEQLPVRYVVEKGAGGATVRREG